MRKTHSNTGDLVSGIFGVMQSESYEFKDLIAASGLVAEAGEISDIDLSGVDLSGQDLSDLDLGEACFEDTKLDRTNLLGAKIDPIEIQFSQDYKKAEIGQSVLTEIDSARLETILSTKIADIDLRIRTLNSLKLCELVFVGELIQLNEWELLHIPYFGRKCLKELQEVFDAMGLSFGMKLPESLQTRFPRPKSPDFGAEAYMIERFGQDFRNKSYFIKNLREVRVRADLRQTDLASRANISINTVRKYEKERSKFGLSEYYAVSIIKALGRFANLLEITTK